MDERWSGLEARLERLAGRVADLERRLAAVEVRGGAAAVQPAGAAMERPLLPLAADFSSLAALLGRTLVVLGGAYLLRAFTDAGTLPPHLGVPIGLIYALIWIGMAGRAGIHGQSLNAAFHGGAFVLIAFPLVFEAATRFRLVGPAGAAAGLAVLAALTLAVAARARLQGFAWVTTLGGLATAGVLMLATEALGPFAMFLVLLGVATLWLGYVLDWTLLRWPVALVADVTILVLAVRAVLSRAGDGPGMALTMQVVLLVAYLGSFAARTLFLNRDVIPFEIAQSVGAIAVGLGGAAYVTTMTGVGALPLGLATLGLAVGCYAVALAFVERRQARRRNFYFYTSAALVFAMAGCALVLPRPPLAVAYAAVGLAAACAGRVSRRIVFHVHGAVYLVAAVVLSGLFIHVLYGLGLPAAPARPATAAMLTVLALCAAALWGLGSGAADSSAAPAARVPRLVVLVLALGGWLAVAAGWLGPAIAGGDAAGLDPGRLATVRTALLVSCVLALAWAGRAAGFAEGAWLVYPLLALTGLKFVLEDFRVGRPGTLFLAFALYGLALIVAPRLFRRPAGAKETTA
jgi:hypothetical protein